MRGARQLKSGAALFPAAALAALALVDDTEVPEGACVWVVTVRDFFSLEKTSTATADGITTIATASGTGRWRRLCLPALKWQEQTTWYINASTGSDEATGVDSAHAIKTFAEWKRRVGRDIRVVMDVYLETSLPSTDKFDVNAYVHITGGLRFHGTRTVVASGTLTARTARDAAANTPNDITDAGTPQVWTSLVGKLVGFTASGAYAWVAKDLGGNAARISVPTTTTDQRSSCAEVVLAGNEAYEVYDTTTVYLDRGIIVDAAYSDPPTSSPPIYFDDIQFLMTSTANTPYIESAGGAALYLRRCGLVGGLVDGLSAMCCSWYSSSGSTAAIYALKRSPSIVGCLSFRICLMNGGGGAYTYLYKTGLMMQGARLLVNGVASLTADISVFDATGAGVSIGNGGLVYGASKIYGSGNTTYGLDLASGGRLISSIPANLTITGTSGDVSFAGASPGNQLPDIKASAGGSLPSASACTTWAQWAASPFSGKVLDYGNGIYMGP